MSEPTTVFGQTSLNDAAAARIARRVLQQWPLILAVTLIAAGSAYFASSTRTKQYEATTSVLPGSVDVVSLLLQQNLASAVDPERQAALNAKLVNQPNVRDIALSKLSGVSSDRLAAAITTDVDVSSSLLTVTARDPDPLLAQKMSVAITQAFIESRSTTARNQIVEAKKRIRSQYNNLSAADQSGATGQELLERLRSVGAAGSLGLTIEVAQPARVPTSPVAPLPRRDAALGGFAGLLLGLAVALLLARLDDRVRDVDELEEIWGLPVVGLVPQSGSLREAGPHIPDGAALEALSLARTNLRYLRVGGDVKTVIVTSALEGEGKSTITWSLALAASLAKSRVLVIEADLRRPAIASRAGVNAKSGLSEILAELAELDDVIVPVKILDSERSIDVSVDVLPAGQTPPSPVALLELPKMAATLDRLRDRYDIILIDTPPATIVADAIAFMDTVDGVVIVSRLGTVRRSALERLKKLVEGIDTPIVGQVVNSGAEARSYGYTAYTAAAKSRWWSRKATPATSKS